ncbi:hypothetical protein K2P97_07495 [bacterium]|nr:hypothetical protein [bacterium]
MSAIGSKFVMVNMEEFVKNNYEDATDHLSALRDAKYWSHFVALSEFYRDLVSGLEPDYVTDDLKKISLHYLNGNMVNFVKGVSMVLSGHPIDSNMFIRRTVESIRYLTFLRANPEAVQLWTKRDFKLFEKKYRDWFRKKENQELVDLEIPRSNYHFNVASSYGPHSNIELFSSQHDIVVKDEQMYFTAHFRDPDPTEISFLVTYFWHLETHFKILNWWIYKSGWVTLLSPEQTSYWSDCRKAFERHRTDIKNKLKAPILD